MSITLHVIIAVCIAALCIAAAANPFLAVLAGAFFDALATEIEAAPLAWLLWLSCLIGACAGVHELLEQRTLRAVGLFVLAAGALGWLFALAERVA